MNYITQIDSYILNVIQQFFQNSFFDTFFPILTSLGNKGFIWIIFGILLLCRKTSRRYGVLLLVSLGISFVVGNLTLKNLVMRVRPCEVNPLFPLLIARPMDSSFPS
ncbi:MAG: phosphatase PAP2 family protein, partial [Oscillospiraceae bacterium]